MAHGSWFYSLESSWVGGVRTTGFGHLDFHGHPSKVTRCRIPGFAMPRSHSMLLFPSLHSEVHHQNTPRQPSGSSLSRSTSWKTAKGTTMRVKLDEYTEGVRLPYSKYSPVSLIRPFLETRGTSWNKACMQPAGWNHLGQTSESYQMPSGIIRLNGGHRQILESSPIVCLTSSVSFDVLLDCPHVVHHELADVAWCSPDTSGDTFSSLLWAGSHAWDLGRIPWDLQTQ